MENQVISTCDLVKEAVAVNRDSPFSLIQSTTYATVNTCTGEEVGRYEIRELTDLGFSGLLFTIFIFFISIISYLAYRYGQ
jgi:hypothetical protein